MFPALASYPLADDGPAAVAGPVSGVFMVTGAGAGAAALRRGVSSGQFAVIGLAAARVPAGQVQARVASPAESRNFARLLTGALHPGRTQNNRKTGDTQ